MRKIKNTALNVLGWLCLIGGTVSLFIPFVPGLVLIAAGVYLLSRHSPWTRCIFKNLRMRYPRFFNRAVKGEGE